MFDPVSGNYTSLADTGYTRQQIVEWFNALSARTGASVEPSDIDQLIAKLMGEGKYIPELGGNPQAAFDLYETQYRLRGGNVAGSGAVATTITPAQSVPTPTITPVYQTSVASAAAGGPSALSGSTYSPAGLMTPRETLAGPYSFASAPSPTIFGMSPFMLALLAAAGIAAFMLLRK